MSKRILVGKIVSAHGIKGDFKVMCHADDPLLLFGDAGVFASQNAQERVLITPRAEPKPNLFIASMDGCTDRDGADALRGTQLFVERDYLPNLEDKDGIYHADLEGLEVRDQDGQVLGHIEHVQNFGAGDLLDVKGPKGSFFVPFAEPHLISTHVDEGYVVVSALEVM